MDSKIKEDLLKRRYELKKDLDLINTSIHYNSSITLNHTSLFSSSTLLLVCKSVIEKEIKDIDNELGI